MRKFTFLCTLICLGFIASGQNGEEENIKKATLAKIDAYRSRNIEAWKASWQHDAKISNTVITNDFYNTIKGWDSLEVMMERDIKQNPKPDSTTQVKLDNFSVRTDGNMALVDYDMIFTPTTDLSLIYPYTGVLHYHSYEVLVKENGQWKTNTRIVTLPQSYDVNKHATEFDLNTAGYDLLSAKKINEAIEVFKLNVKLFPDSWNTYDSLGEALALAGNKKEAVENYEKSIKLNPKSD
ncbi:MAG: tetratricopeptide repeat protein, partial [Bacteroidota bacterium]|nr:tetratricopeptide repeat protein [Bacteroidota bacterium]